MPIYEYKCHKCGYRFEKEQSHKDKPETRCPSDGCQGRVGRVFSPPAIVFKGKGWHVTDYGKGKAEATSSCEKSATCAKSGTCPAAAAD